MMSSLSASHVGRSRAAKLARWTLPFLISALFFAYLVSSIDFRTVLTHMTPWVALYFTPPLLLFLFVNLVLEAICLEIIVSQSRPFASLWTAARIKAASYLLGLVNYALGAGAVTVLLRRRAGLTLSDAAGVVFVIGLFDLLTLIVIVVVGSLLLEAGAPGVQAGVVIGAGAAIAAGFAVLRAPTSLGVLDRLRDLQVFSAARTLPIAILLRLGGLRVAFVGSYLLLVWAALATLEVSVPWLELAVNVSVLLLISSLPIAAAGLGTGQLAFVALLEEYGDAETLLAASLMISVGLIITRSILGVVFAREFTSEALEAQREQGADDVGAAGDQ